MSDGVGSSTNGLCASNSWSKCPDWKKDTLKASHIIGHMEGDPHNFPLKFEEAHVIVFIPHGITM